MVPSLNFKIVGIDAEQHSIYPRLRIQINVRAEQVGQNDTYIGLEGMRLNLAVLNEGNVETHLPLAVSEYELYTAYTTENSIIFHLELDYFGLSQIEKIRNNKDLRLRARLNFTSDIPSQYKHRNPPGQQDLGVYTVPKSTWVETILPSFNFRDVFLLEIPKLIENVENRKLVEYLNGAQKKLSLGDYPGVLVDCQKALEEMKVLAKTKGYTTESGKIDFGKLTDANTIKTALDNVWSSLWNFSQPGGRHIGSDRGREEAWFAILTTYGMVNLIMSNLSSQAL